MSKSMWIGLASVAMAMAASDAHAVLHINESAGYSINWNGNDGVNFSAGSPALVPTNLASTSNGATPFTSSDLGPELGIPFHRAVNVNDGRYSNANSWISASGDAVHALGVSFSSLQNVTSIAWGRDNGDSTVADCCGGQATDRTAGVYTLQRTIVAAPGAGTGNTGNAATGWETIGTFNYFGNAGTALGGGFTQWFRHEYDIALNGGAVPATGFRLVVPQGGLGAGTAVDEFEAYSGVVNLGLALVSVGAGPAVPDNLALASNGSVAFAKDLLNGDGFGVHAINELNDGVYGNSNSWIGNSDPTFAGIKLSTPAVIGSVAFGRDSGGEAQVITDRDAGAYLLQYTLDLNAGLGTLDSAWITIGSATIDPSDPQGHLRHLYSFDPVFASGVRIITQGAGIDIDEIEVFAGTLVVPEPATMSLLGLGVLLLGRRVRRDA